MEGRLAKFDMILRAVMSGFLQAQGISVPLGQMEKLFGIKMNGYFIESVYTLFKEVLWLADFDGE